MLIYNKNQGFTSLSTPNEIIYWLIMYTSPDYVIVKS
jgi:hypothetical protein